MADKIDKLITEGDKIDFRDILTKQQIHDGITPNVYVSQVLEFTSKGHIMVAMPIKQTHLVPLSKGAQYEIVFYTHKGLYQSIAQIVERYRNDNIYSMEIILIRDIQKYQRRQYYRLEKSIPIKYAHLTEDEYRAFAADNKKIPERLQKSGDFNDGVSVDISGGGLRFIGNKFIEKDKKLAVRFEITTAAGVREYYLPAKVIMGFELPDRVSRYEQRVEFAGISDESREVLIKYIFEEERKMRQSGK